MEGRTPGLTGQDHSMTARRAAPVVAGLVGRALVVFGVVLVATGDDSAPPSSTPPSSGAAGPRATLPLDSTSQSAVEGLTGLVLPPTAADFLTARLADGTQLDVTFTIPTAEEPAFVTGSGLPDLEAGTRVVTHSSPLWKLNPDGTIRGATDTRGRVRRAVELVPEGTDRLRARVVISPNG